eukprot:TRINITY_DN91381_c0_g1_i1.p1 TRINITY_DN91381_c0_g1~~TRINITY_DN91381_c0_g1_i1.p1  ORF type:complete len:332 (+),score=71.27 TRINITY_DN91381_c0_g1_i1:83-1078(+)
MAATGFGAPRLLPGGTPRGTPLGHGTSTPRTAGMMALTPRDAMAAMAAMETTGMPAASSTMRTATPRGATPRRTPPAMPSALGSVQAPHAPAVSSTCAGATTAPLTSARAEKTALAADLGGEAAGVGGRGPAAASAVAFLPQAEAVNEVTSKKPPLIQIQEPKFSDVFYKTTNGMYKGYWHGGHTSGEVLKADVPQISEVLSARGRSTIRKPVRPILTTAKCTIANIIEEELKKQVGEKVLSADVIPKVFPVKVGDISYPASGKIGSNNPLYKTHAQEYGKEPPEKHQISDRYFPNTNHFTNQFVDAKPRNTGLATAPTFSKTHKALDQYY